MKRLIALILLFSSLAACTRSTPELEPEVILHTYPVTNDVILNPERGFFTPYTLPGPAGFSPVRMTGNTLVHLNIRLDKWREADIPQDVLDGLDQNFEDIRDGGVKAILRVAYNEGPFPDSDPDASKTWILRHIEQLKPLFQKHGDVIAWVEAGFIGAWGEWHTSTNGLDNLPDKQEILSALLAALPENRMAQVRYPANIIEMYPAPMDAVAARVAHHNDCFLSSNTDVGTYERDGENTIIRDQAYLNVLTRYTPMSGESCAPNPPRSECESAIEEMELLHFSAINEAYHKGILRSWKDGGCMDEIENRLGYRLALTSASYNEKVRPGGLVNLSVEITNTGFAALMNPRPLYVLLKGSNTAYQVRLDLDPREWQPGVSSFTVKLRIPATIEAGSAVLSLWLPDEAETLQSNPLYAVRFANEAVWDEITGANILGQILVDDSTTGSFEKGESLKVVELNHTPAVIQPVSTAEPVSVMPTPMPTVEALVQPSTLISDLQVAYDAENLTIQFGFSGSVEIYNGFQIFLDTDQNATSGLSIGGIGADFLLENGTLSTYAGTGADWQWTQLTEAEITYENGEQTARWQVRLADLGNPAALDLAAQLVDTGWNTVELTGKVVIQIP